MFRFSLCVYLFFFSVIPLTARSFDLAGILQKAESKQLYDDPYWHVLLHYQKGMFGVVSEVNAGHFFLATGGRFDPEAELLATIEAFFEPADTTTLTDIEKHARCSFPARYRFIRDSLQLTDDDFPVVGCENFEIYRKEFDAKSISYMFASYYMAAPASIYGHTFMKFNSDRRRRGELLDYAMNFAADTGDLDFFRYALYGFIGGYNGYYSLMSYHVKVREYNDMEDRDLWEYELDLTDRQVYLLQLHLWELLSRSSFRYFFASKNCSYQLLTLLEAASPDSDLSSVYLGWVIPSETVKLLKKRGLIRDVRYRPSARSALRQRMKELTEAERDYVLSAIKHHLEPMLTPTERNMYLFDTMIAAMSYRQHQDTWTDEDQSFYRLLLRRRAELPSFDDRHIYAPESTPVDQGHDPVMIRLGAGADTDGSSLKFVFRPIYHDFLAADTGYMPFSELEVFSFRLRMSESQKPRLESARIGYLYSLSPIDSLTFAPSYMVDMGFRSIRSQKVDRKKIPLLLAASNPNDHDQLLPFVMLQQDQLQKKAERRNYTKVSKSDELLYGVRQQSDFVMSGYADVLYGMSVGNVFQRATFRYAAGVLGGAALETSSLGSFLIPRASLVFVGGTATSRIHLQPNCYAGVRNGCELQWGFGHTIAQNHELRVEGVYDGGNNEFSKDNNEFFFSYSYYF